MNQGQGDEKQSWLSIGWLAVCCYWFLWGMFRFFAWLECSRPMKMFWFVIVCSVCGMLIKAVHRWVNKVVLIHPTAHHDEEMLPFFVKGQVRRRKLDLTRSSNFLSDSIGKKQKSQTSGILRSGKKKKKKRR